MELTDDKSPMMSGLTELNVILAHEIYHRDIPCIAYASLLLQVSFSQMAIEICRVVIMAIYNTTSWFRPIRGVYSTDH